jgi:hypothetical protein
LKPTNTSRIKKRARLQSCREPEILVLVTALKAFRTGRLDDAVATGDTFNVSDQLGIVLESQKQVRFAEPGVKAGKAPVAAAPPPVVARVAPVVGRAAAAAARVAAAKLALEADEADLAALEAAKG